MGWILPSAIEYGKRELVFGVILVWYILILRVLLVVGAPVLYSTGTESGGGFAVLDRYNGIS